MTRGAFWTSQPVKTPTARAAVVTLLVVSGLLSGCSGGGAVRPDPLPFHVAVVPGPLTASRSDEIFRPESPEEVAEGSLALDFERDSSESSESFFAALVEALDEDVFAQATLLDLPPAHAAIDEGERDRDAIRQSQRQEADLLLTCRVDYDRTIIGGTNGYFFINLPLWLLGGPLCWWVEDRTY